MKAFCAWLKLWLIFSLLSAGSSVFAEDNETAVRDSGFNAYLSEMKRRELSYDYQKNKVDSSKLRDSWIQPIILSYHYRKSEPYDNTQTVQNAAISLDQPIFQSGGIYYGIKFAEASRKYADFSVDQQRRKLIKDTVSLLMQINQSGLKEERQKLQIANSQIALEQKQEQYLNGQLDSGFLNNAIIETNVVTQALYDIETNKERLLSKFRALSDLDYSNAAVPRLRLINEADFLENNIDMKVIESETEKNRYNKNVTIAKYLPKVSLTASYNWDKSEHQQFGNTGAGFSGETHYKAYGWKASMPLDINTFRDIESARVTYLKSKVLIDDRKRELKALFEQVMQNLENYDKKIELARQNEELYSRLLGETNTLYKAGYKTVYDVRNLENSVKIQALDRQIFEMDKQLELLNLYEKLTDDV